MSEDTILVGRFPGRRAALKREILEQALACFNEFGVEATTIDVIKARCETSVGAIYHHFGNKEGILATLFFAAQGDQHERLEQYLELAESQRGVVSAIVSSYVDWVVAHPDWARFLFQARSSVAKGPRRQDLEEQNAKRFRELKEKLVKPGSSDVEIVQPFELLPSLIIGASENYCRAWLAGRVQTPPDEFRERLAESAWQSVRIFG